MATATLVPTSLTDSNSNVASGAYTDVDSTIASASGSLIKSVSDAWTGGTGTGSAFTFGLSDLPANADSINTVRFRVRGQVYSAGATADYNDLIGYTCDVSGTNAPSTTAKWTQADVNDSLANRGAAAPVTSSATVAQVNSWTVRVYQDAYTDINPPESAADSANLQIDEIEIIVDYDEAAPAPPSSPPSGSGYSVIPTADTVIYGMCIARVRDFVVIGGMDTDRYGIRWSALADPTDWPTPATDDARSKQSGSQTFPTEFGHVTGIAGDDFHMYVFQERAISRAAYVGGDVVFSFDTFNEGVGCRRQGRILKVDDRVFFQSARGYHMLLNGQVVDIGLGKVDDSFSG